MLPDRETELEGELLDAHKAFRRIAAVFGLERKIPCTSSGWEELATAVEDRVAILKEPDLVKRARMALELDDKTPPKERFRRMVESGLICDEGCVLCYGSDSYGHDDERHIFNIGDTVRMTFDFKKRAREVGNGAHIDEFGDCIGRVAGPVKYGAGAYGPELNVRWRPSKLRYAYHPHQLTHVEEE